LQRRVRKTGALRCCRQGGVLVGDKSPKSKNKSQKQNKASKDKKAAAAAAEVAAKKKAASK
jgi:hypothetical protein